MLPIPTRALLGALIIFTVLPAGAQKDAPKPAKDAKAPAAAATMPDLSKGAFYGKVLDLAGKPVPDATVALIDKNGKPIAWTKTNAQGQYAIGTDCLKLLNLEPSRRRGLLEEICKGIGEVVTVPVKVAGAAVKVVKDAASMKTVENVAVAAATGNPTPVAVQAVNTAADAVKGTKTEAPKQTTAAAVKTVFGDTDVRRKADPKALAPGEVMLAVTAPSYKPVQGKASAFWLEGPASTELGAVGTQAWLETVKLDAASDGKKSEITHEAMLLSDLVVEPALVPAGGTLKLSVKLQNPTGLNGKARVFAREERKGTVVELKPDEKNKDLFTGTLTLDPKEPVGETKISVGALRAEPLEVKLPKGKEDPLTVFCGRVEEMEPGKPYSFDPRIMASENRLDATVTVLDSKHATPTLPPGATVSPTPPAPAKPAAPPAKPGGK